MKKLLKSESNSLGKLRLTLKMKISLFLIFLAIFTMQANNSYSQNTKLSLDMKNVTVMQVIDEIESQTEFKFVFNTKAVDLDRRVTLKVNKKKVKEILNTLFSNSQTTFEIDNRKILLKKTLHKTHSTKKDKIDNKKEQELEIKGQVLDNRNTPLQGASIIQKGTTNGVITDFEGNFSITVSSINTVLVISYLGFESKEINIVSSSEELKIILKEEGFSLDDIVVTARKRVENVQDTPISITAVQGVVLEEMGVTNISGVGDIAPNLTFSTTGTVSGSSSAAVVYIRGIGQNDYVPVADPGVGIYVDEVYLGRTVGAVLDLADLKSVEVIRGPQGTLFGRNSIGGAISLISNDPGEELKGKVSLTGGSYSRNDATFRISGPLSESLGFTFNVIRRNREGYVERVFVEDSYLGDDNSHGARLKLDYQKPTSKFSAKFIIDFATEREESAAEQNLFFHDDRLLPELWNTNAAASPTSTASGYIPGDTSAGTDIYDERWNFGPFKTGETSLSQNDIDTWGSSLNLKYKTGENSDAKLILAYRNLDAEFARQTDGSPLNIFENRDIYKQDQFSADIRFSQSNDKLDFVTGLFYFIEDVDNSLSFTGALQNVAYPVFLGGLVENSNYAIYGEATYKITDKLSITGGLRYTNETKKARPDAFRDPSVNLGDAPNVPDGIRDADTNPRRLLDKIWQENTFDQVTWRFNTAYKVSEALNIYGTVSTGFKSGGFEWRVTNTSFYDDPSNDFDGDGDGDLPQFAPETVTSYELGAKVKVKKLRFNTAFFYTDYKDLQIAANPPGSIATFQTNAGDAEIKGLETEIIWLPSSSILVNLGYGYTDAEYKDLIEGVTVTEDDNFILTPEHTLTFGGSYKIPVSFGSFTPRIDGHYKSRVDFEAQNSDFVFDDGHTALNASLKFNAKKHWEFIIGVENLTDELYLIGGDANTAIGYENGIYARPRNYYATLSYSF
ncbi:TonB-dependent receptor domain-containing protein [Aquimarina sp. 2304DJ70-9]|uniref:TonB-dependent receptor domain-containing protein n=1 Tax=Aquimarina penaris TaxID=3231044 RepID=UPI003462C8E7